MGSIGESVVGLFLIVSQTTCLSVVAIQSLELQGETALGGVVAAGAVASILTDLEVRFIKKRRR